MDAKIKLLWRTGSKALTIDLYLKQDGLCHWCGRKTFIGGEYHNRANQATIDHLKTKRDGRMDYMDGGHVLACSECNHDKGSSNQILHMSYAEKKKSLRRLFNKYKEHLRFVKKHGRLPGKVVKPKEVPVDSISQDAIICLSLKEI